MNIPYDDIRWVVISPTTRKIHCNNLTKKEKKMFRKKSLEKSKKNSPSILDLPGDIILKIIDIPRMKGKKKQIRNEYKGKNPYYSLITLNKCFNNRFSEVDILIPVMASYSARAINKEHLKYICGKLSISLNKSDKCYDMRKKIYFKIKDDRLNDKGHNAFNRKESKQGIREDWFLRKHTRSPAPDVNKLMEERNNGINL